VVVILIVLEAEVVVVVVAVASSGRGSGRVCSGVGGGGTGCTGHFGRLVPMPGRPGGLGFEPEFCCRWSLDGVPLLFEDCIFAPQSCKMLRLLQL